LSSCITQFSASFPRAIICFCVAGIINGFLRPWWGGPQWGEAGPVSHRSPTSFD